MMLVASCVPFSFSAPCDDMLFMLVCATRWLSMHLHTLAYVFMHKSCLPVCRLCFNTMRLWTFNPNLHCPSWTPPFVCFLACLIAFLFLCLPCLSCLFVLCLSHMLFASFPSITCLLVSCLCLCMYTHGVKMLGARAQSPRRKQKGREGEHVEISQVVVFSRFKSLVYPFGYVLF